MESQRGAMHGVGLEPCSHLVPVWGGCRRGAPWDVGWAERSRCPFGFGDGGHGHVGSPQPCRPDGVPALSVSFPQLRQGGFSPRPGSLPGLCSRSMSPLCCAFWQRGFFRHSHSQMRLSHLPDSHPRTAPGLPAWGLGTGRWSWWRGGIGAVGNLGGFAHPRCEPGMQTPSGSPEPAPAPSWALGAAGKPF